MAKNLWILNHYARTDDDVGGARHLEISRNLAKKNWAITIVASSVAHRTNKSVIEGDKPYSLSYIDGVRFVWLKGSKYSTNGLPRLINMIEYFLRSLFVLPTLGIDKPDYIIGSSVHPLAGLSAYFLALRYNARFIFEVRDLWPLTLIEMRKILKHGIAARLMESLEAFLYNRSDHIVSVLPKAYLYMSRYRIPREKVTWIPNGATIKSYSANPAQCNSLFSPFTFMYLGSLGEANDVENIIIAFRLLRQANIDSIHLRIVGTGTRIDSLQRLSLCHGTLGKTVFFEPPVPRKDVSSVSSQADAFVLSVRDLPGLYKYGFSMNKIYEYMAAAKPIVIATGYPENPIALAECGLTVEPDNPQLLANALNEIAQAKSTALAAYGHNAITYLRKYSDYSRLADNLESLLLSL